MVSELLRKLAAEEPDEATIVKYPHARAFARFLTADVADEETAAGLSELPVLLFQAMGFVMRSGIAARGFNHGWTRIHTDPVLWCVVPSDPHERGNHE